MKSASLYVLASSIFSMYMYAQWITACTMVTCTYQNLLIWSVGLLLLAVPFKGNYHNQKKLLIQNESIVRRDLN